MSSDQAPRQFLKKTLFLFPKDGFDRAGCWIVRRILTGNRPCAVIRLDESAASFRCPGMLQTRQVICAGKCM